MNPRLPPPLEALGNEWMSIKGGAWLPLVADQFIDRKSNLSGTDTPGFQKYSGGFGRIPASHSGSGYRGYLLLT